MSELDALKVANILKSDPVILRDKTNFTDCLSTPEEVTSQLNAAYNNRTISSYEYFKDVLNSWKQRNGNEATLEEFIKILRKEEYNSVADQLEYGSVRHIRKMLVAQNAVDNFVGRRDELDNHLMQWYQNNRHCIALISGIGGQGKTQLCKKFIEELRKKNNYTEIFWIVAENAQTLTKSFADYAKSIGLPIKDEEDKPISLSSLCDNVVEKILSMKVKGWVVVLDNANKTYDLVPTIRKLMKTDVFILLTSRHADIIKPNPSVVKHLPLKVLHDKDAIHFVKITLTNPEQKEEDIVQLCKKLGNYILAIHHAIAFIQSKQIETDDKYGISRYLKEYQKISETFGEADELGEYDKCIPGILQMTINEIANKDALLLLRICTIVQPDAIKEQFLKQLFCKLTTSGLFEAAKTILKTRALIQVANEVVSMHRVVQEIVRDKMMQYSDPQWHVFLRKLLQRFDCSDLDSDEIRHAMSIWKWATDKYKNLTTEFSQMPSSITGRMIEHSLIHEIKQFVEANFILLTNTLGESNIETLKMEQKVARCLKEMGEHENALVKYQSVYDKQKKVLGEKENETLITANNITVVLRRLGKLQDSLELCEKVEQIRKELPIIEKETMTCLKNKAATLIALGEVEKALPICKQVLEWRESYLSRNHPSTISSRSTIATCYLKQGNLIEAKEQLEIILQQRMETLGEKHAHTIKTKARLASTYLDLGEKLISYRMMKEVFVVQEEVMGVNHPRTNFFRELISKFEKKHKIDLSESGEVLSVEALRVA